MIRAVFREVGRMFVLGALVLAAGAAGAADAPKEAPGKAQVLQVTYYYLPG